MEEIFVPLIIFSLMYLTIRYFLDYRLKKMLIDKGVLSEGKVLFEQTGQANSTYAALKWGLVLISTGIAILLHELFPQIISENAAIALMLLFSGISLLAYFRYLKLQNS
jgi:hypothetical protein